MRLSACLVCLIKQEIRARRDDFFSGIAVHTSEGMGRSDI